MADPLSLLPNDLLLSISSYLLTTSDLTRLELVHHRWRRVLSRDDKLWRSLCARRWKDYPRYEVLAWDETEWTREHPRWGPDGAPPRLQDGVFFSDDSPGDDGGDNDAVHRSIAVELSEASSPPELEAVPNMAAASLSPSPPTKPASWEWKNRYRWIEDDVRREQFHSPAEVESLGWYFNFTPQAGGRGEATLARCRFRDGFAEVPMYPPMLYNLVRMDERALYCGVDDRDDIDEEGVGMAIANFPIHTISRIEGSGEWVIGNEAVTFVSCDTSGTLHYDERGFQTAAPSETP